MADYLVDSNNFKVSMGHDGLVVASNGTRFFTTTRTTSPLRIMTSADGGVTWSLFESIPVQTNDTGNGMFIDANDNFHVIHRGNNPASPRDLNYRRYDAPNYTLAVGPELAVPHSSQNFNAWDPLGIIAYSNGTIDVYYMASITPLPRSELRRARRAAGGGWTIDIIILTSLGGEAIAYDVLLGGDGETYVAIQPYLSGSSTLSDGWFCRIRRQSDGANVVVVSEFPNPQPRLMFFPAYVNNEIRLYYSLTDGIAGSAQIFYKTPTIPHTSLFTSSDANDALRGVARDTNGVNLYYGQTSVIPLLRRKHLNGGSVGPETTILNTYNAVHADVDILQTAYPRSITGFTGDAGVYGQPAGSTRFFSTLISTTVAATAAENFLSEWGIQGEELLFAAYKPYDIEGGEEEESEVGRYIKGR